VRTERVVLGELAGHLQREPLAEPLAHVDVRELGELLLGILGELAALLLQQRVLGVALGADRDVLARAHAQRPRGEAGDTRDHDRVAVAGRPGDADDETGRGHDPVVGAEDGCAQPVQSVVEPVGMGLVVVLPDVEICGAGVGRHALIVLGRRPRRKQGKAVLTAPYRPRSRPMSSFMISFVPAQILVTRASRQARATRYSFM
jgi:hypothetical protein